MNSGQPHNESVAGRTRKRRSPEQWRALVEAQSRSDLTQQAFCEREGISVMSLLNWRKRLAGQDAGMTSKAVDVASFVEIGHLAPSASSAPPLTLTLDLGGGVVLTLSRS